MTTINRFKYSPFVEEINLLRYAILGQGGSQLILIFEAEVEGIKKQYMGPANITGSREENEKSFDLAIFKIVDKDLTVSLRLADQLFKNAESQRAFAVTNVWPESGGGGWAGGGTPGGAGGDGRRYA